MKERITLVIVDCQYDFIEGTMAVKGAKECINNIVAFINKNADNIKHIIFTQDWHPVNHCSFKENGGQWPTHCVKHTSGAGIDINLIKAAENHHINCNIIVKGTRRDAEEFGANFDNCPVVDILSTVVCGIAGDYCVKECIKNLIKVRPKVLLSGVASIDDGTTIKNFIKENKLEVVE